MLSGRHARTGRRNWPSRRCHDITRTQTDPRCVRSFVTRPKEGAPGRADRHLFGSARASEAISKITSGRNRKPSPSMGGHAFAPTRIGRGSYRSGARPAVGAEPHRRCCRTDRAARTHRFDLRAVQGVGIATIHLGQHAFAFGISQEHLAVVGGSLSLRDVRLSWTLKRISCWPDSSVDKYASHLFVTCSPADLFLRSPPRRGLEENGAWQKKPRAQRRTHRVRRREIHVDKRALALNRFTVYASEAPRESSGAIEPSQAPTMDFRPTNVFPLPHAGGLSGARVRRAPACGRMPRIRGGVRAMHGHRRSHRASASGLGELRCGPGTPQRVVRPQFATSQ